MMRHFSLEEPAVTDAEIEAAFQLVNTTWHCIRSRDLIRQVLKQFIANRVTAQR
jgi:hypothetical protein